MSVETVASRENELCARSADQRGREGSEETAVLRTPTARELILVRDTALVPSGVGHGVHACSARVGATQLDMEWKMRANE